MYYGCMRDDIHIQWQIRLREMEKVRRQYLRDVFEEEGEDDVPLVIEVRRPLVDVAVSSSSSSSSRVPVRD